MERKEILANSETMPSLSGNSLTSRLEPCIQIQKGPGSTSPRDVATVLKERAKALAQAPPPTEADGAALGVVTFRLAQEAYGLESCYVREVYPLKELAALPGAPLHLLGITSVRGQILPVVDLKPLFHLPATGLTNLNNLIILQEGGMGLGIVADQILGFERIHPAALCPPPEAIAGVRAEYLQGIASGPRMILDGRRILNGILDVRGAEAELASERRTDRSEPE
jgi:purine-binding chemotaxis protein CheW